MVGGFFVFVVFLGSLFFCCFVCLGFCPHFFIFASVLSSSSFAQILLFRSSTAAAFAQKMCRYEMPFTEASSADKWKRWSWFCFSGDVYLCF